MEREYFLANISRKLQSAYLPGAVAQKPSPPTLPDSNNENLVEQFTNEVITLSGEVHDTNSDSDAYESILDIFAQKQASEFIAWDDEHLPIADLNARLTAHGYTKHDLDIPNDPQTRRDTHLGLSDVGVGLTSAMGALADTGTLVVQCGIGRGRLASLLPPVHIAVLKKNQLYPSIAHFIRAHPDAAKETSNLVFITGPSRTADIEQTLTLGVHGPKELHVILV
ncbi:MAG: LutC/YkgG family protein [Ardenticatenaceae bacterium]